MLDARFFVTAVLTQRESGGNLAEVLDNLAVGDARSLQGQAADPRDLGARPDQRLGAVAACRRLLAGLLYFLAAQTSCASWSTIRSACDLVIAAVVLQLIGTLIISRLVRIEYLSHGTAADRRPSSCCSSPSASAAAAAVRGSLTDPHVTRAPAGADWPVGRRPRQRCRSRCSATSPSAMAQRARRASCRSRRRTMNRHRAAAGRARATTAPGRRSLSASCSSHCRCSCSSPAAGRLRAAARPLVFVGAGAA